MEPHSYRHWIYGGDERDRTADPLLAKQVLSQLSYSPIRSIGQGTTVPRLRNRPRRDYPTARSLPCPIRKLQMVGPGRLELPTPRLSSVCSNQLSYGPIRGTGRRGFVFLKKEKHRRRILAISGWMWLSLSFSLALEGQPNRPYSTYYVAIVT